MDLLWIEGPWENAPTRKRRKDCPAFGTVCGHCSRDHHFRKMCRSRNDAKTARNGTEGAHENAISNTLCEVTSEMIDKYATLDHHIHNQSTGKWSKRQSKSQPFIRLYMCVRREDYECFGFKLRTPQSQILTYAMTDTGCQSCLAGLKVIQRLRLTAKDLIPVRLKMHAADNHAIKILGATILRLSGKDNTGGGGGGM